MAERPQPAVSEPRTAAGHRAVPAITGDPAPGMRARRVPQIALLVVLSAIWTLLMRQLGTGRIYWLLGPYALLVGLILFAAQRGTLAQQLVSSRRAVVLGCVAGAGMTLLTYPAFAAATALVPALRPEIAALYHQAQQGSPVVAALWILAIATAEELLWRGAWLAVLRPYLGAPWAAVASTALYALAQLGSGSWVVAALALACGGVWTGLRLATGSLVSSLLAHLVWTPTVLLVVPVV